MTPAEVALFTPKPGSIKPFPVKIVDNVETQVIDIMCQVPDESPVATTSPVVPTKELRTAYHRTSPKESDSVVVTPEPQPKKLGTGFEPTPEPVAKVAANSVEGADAGLSREAGHQQLFCILTI